MSILMSSDFVCSLSITLDAVEYESGIHRAVAAPHLQTLCSNLRAVDTHSDHFGGHSINSPRDTFWSVLLSIALEH